jgi:hypothetical protein
MTDWKTSWLTDWLNNARYYFLHSRGPESLLPCIQEPVTFNSSEPDESSPSNAILFL